MSAYVERSIEPTGNVPRWLFGRVPAGSLALFAAIDLHAAARGDGEAGRVAWPGLERLAKHLGDVSVDTVRRRLLDLERVGAVERRQGTWPDTGRPAPNIYTLHHDPRDAATAAARNLETAERRRQRDAETKAKRAARKGKP